MRRLGERVSRIRWTFRVDLQDLDPLWQFAGGCGLDEADGIRMARHMSDHLLFGDESSGKVRYFASEDHSEPPRAKTHRRKTRRLLIGLVSRIRG